jgi:hypothetical protein
MLKVLKRGIAEEASSVLVVCDLRIQIRYLENDDEIKVNEFSKLSFGRGYFPHASILSRDVRNRVSVRCQLAIMNPAGL